MGEKMEEEKVIQIGEEDYPRHIVEAYVKALNIRTPPDDIVIWPYRGGGIVAFAHGYTYGCDVTTEEMPDCDECNVHEKAAEAGPPESHYSQQDR